jgi:hypothetical protein
LQHSCSVVSVWNAHVDVGERSDVEQSVSLPADRIIGVLSLPILKSLHALVDSGVVCCGLGSLDFDELWDFFLDLLPVHFDCGVLVGHLPFSNVHGLWGLRHNIVRNVVVVVLIVPIV